jgi:hypothetical protein
MTASGYPNRRVTIMTPASDHQANNETHGRKECAARMVTNRDKSPLREILASFRFYQPQPQLQ